MKRIALSLAVVFSMFVGSLHADKNPADYPLKVSVLARRGMTHFHNGYADWYRGDGKGDLRSDSSIQGFDFTYECNYNFPINAEGEFTPAKWKKNGSELLVLFGEIGSNKHHECELKVTMIAGIYKRSPRGGLVAVSLDEYNKMNYEEHPGDVDPKDFALHAALVQVKWAKTTMGFNGSGSGNLKDGDKVHAFDFSTHCGISLRLSRPGTSFRARWLKDGTLELLAHRTGDQSAAVCDLQTTMRDYVYIRYASGQLQTYTQAQYAHWLAMQLQNPDALPDPQILERPFAQTASNKQEPEADPNQ